MKIFEHFEHPTFKVTKLDKTLIEYIKNNLDDVVYKSISEIARGANIGEATVTRFTKKLGFNGFQEFKITLAKELSVHKEKSIISSNVCKNEAVRDTAIKVLDSTQYVLKETVDGLDYSKISESRDLILQGSKIYLIGVGHSSIIALDFNYRFMRIGINSYPMIDGHTMIMMAPIMNASDVIIAISHSGATREILQTVDKAKANGVKVISLTEQHNNELKQKADVCLTYISTETIFETGSIESRIPQIFLMDLVYAEVIKAHFDESLETKMKTTQAIENFYH